MDIEEILKQNKKVAELFSEINTWKPILFQEDNNSEDNTWGSHIDENGNAVISYCETNNKLTYLAHELLHFKVQKDGYRRIKSCCYHPLFRNNELLDALDNELQHHKMFPIFIGLGLDGKKFYCDSDLQIYAVLKRNLEKNSNQLNDFIVDYFSLIAPGGTLSNQKKDILKHKFQKKVGKDYLDKIDIIFRNWIRDKSFNSEIYIKQIYNLIEPKIYAWIGYGKSAEFPNNGFFINEPF